MLLDRMKLANVVPHHLCGFPWLMMLRRTPLWPPRRDCRDIRLDLLHFHTICLGGQFHQSMQGDFHPWTSGLIDLHEVCENTADDGLVSDNQDIATSLKFHHDGFKTDDNVTVGLAATVAIVVFIGIAGGEIFGVHVVDFLVGETVAIAAVEFIEGFPFKFFPAKFGDGRGGGLVGTFEGTSPDGKGGVCGEAGLAEEFGEHFGVLEAAGAEVCIAADFAFEVVFAFTMAGEPNGTGFDVEVCEEVYQAGLEVVLDAVDDDLVTDVGDLDVGEVFFGLVDGLVDFFVHFDTIAKVFGCFFRVLTGQVLVREQLDIAQILLTQHNQETWS